MFNFLKKLHSKECNLNKLTTGYICDIKNDINELQQLVFLSQKHCFEVKLVKKEATMPTKAHATDAGYDLYAPRDFTFKFCKIAAQNGKHMYIDTGVAINIACGFLGLVCPRSSMSMRSLPCDLGVIDAGYQGTIKVLFSLPKGRHEDDEVIIKAGDRIGQIVFLNLPTIALTQVADFLNTSERGTDGCGSSGR